MTDIPTEAPAEQPTAYDIIHFVCGEHNDDTCQSPGIAVVIPIDLYVSPPAVQREFRLSYLRSMANVFDTKIEELRKTHIARDPGTDRQPWPRDMVVTLDVVTVPATLPMDLGVEPAAGSGPEAEPTP